MTQPNNDNKRKWYKKRENILFCLGVSIFIGEFIHAELLGGTFHTEFLVGAGAMCGLGVAHKGDKE